MKILVVDDAESALLLMVRFIETLGHQAIAAGNGFEAVQAWRRESPDLVLMDMMMPVMSGPQAAAIIKEESEEGWIPIVFVTGVGEEKILADAIERCGDDYLNKPVSFRVLGAKLKAFERTLDLNRKVRDQSAKLASYYDRSEEEKRVVRHLMDQLVSSERLADPSIDYWLASAESLSGDLIAAARTPGNVLHVLLADGIGHGMSAALNVLPLTQPFYGMTEKGHALSEILAEMNHKVRQVLPVGRFVAVAMIAINEVDRCIEVWNGGMPDQKILDESGVVIGACKSFSLPLGIVSSDAMDFSPCRFYFDKPGVVVAYSDGLVEARNRSGVVFGLPRLLAAMYELPVCELIAAVQSALHAFMDGEVLHDDVSLVLAAFGTGGVEAQSNPMGGQDFDWREPESLVASNRVLWRYDLALGIEELRYISAVPFVMNFVIGLKSLRHYVADVFQILEALFTNALDYGVLGLNPPIGYERSERLTYMLKERALRLAELPCGRIEIGLAGIECAGAQVIRIRVKDSGQGFDWYSRIAPEVDFPPLPGRGIRLVKSLCAGLRYQGNGSEAVAYYIPH